MSNIRHHGVTLIEALLVILILSAALAAAPGFSRTFVGRQSITADADELLQTIRLARQTAILHDGVVEVRVVTRPHPADGRNRVAVEWRGVPSPFSPNARWAGPPPPTGTAWLADPIWLAADTQLQANPSTIAFDGKRGLSRDAVWTLTHGPDRRTIRIAAGSGPIHLDST